MKYYSLFVFYDDIYDVDYSKKLFNSGPAASYYFSTLFSCEKNNFNYNIFKRYISKFSFKCDRLDYNVYGCNKDELFVLTFLKACEDLLPSNYKFSDSNNLNSINFSTDCGNDFLENLLKLLFVIISDAGLYTLHDPSILFKYDLYNFRVYCEKNGLRFSLFTLLSLLCSGSRGLTVSSLHSSVFNNLSSEYNFLRTRNLLYDSVV